MRFAIAVAILFARFQRCSTGIWLNSTGKPHCENSLRLFSSGPFSAASICIVRVVYIHNSYDILRGQNFSFLQVPFFNFLHFPSHWVTRWPSFYFPILLSLWKGFCSYVCSSLLTWDNEREKELSRIVRRDWYCIIDNRSTTDLKCRPVKTVQSR